MFIRETGRRRSSPTMTAFSRSRSIRRQLPGAQAAFRPGHQSRRQTGDDEYLELLGKAVRGALEEFHADMLFYVGGADPYREDQLGGLWLSMGGLRRRDELVFGEAKQRGIPVA